MAQPEIIIILVLIWILVVIIYLIIRLSQKQKKHDKLKDFFEKAIRSGMQKEELINSLVKAGWKKEAAEYYYDKFSKAR